jgi:predicted RNA-binding Zn-ribbon protein involved in translation (DUF1610 family)
MAGSEDQDDVPDVLPAGSRSGSHKRRCPVCGREEFVRLGRASETVGFFPPDAEGSLFSLARATQAYLWVCLDCGFLGWFIWGSELDRLREQHG